MKTAISVPDDIFKRAEVLARRTGKSRSRIFSDALREYLSRHTPTEVTDDMDRVCARIGDKADRFVASAAHRTLARSGW